jgi:hypothetical protein
MVAWSSLVKLGKAWEALWRPGEDLESSNEFIEARESLTKLRAQRVAKRGDGGGGGVVEEYQTYIYSAYTYPISIIFLVPLCHPLALIASKLTLDNR